MAEYTDRLRQRLHEKFPDVVFFFEAANITNQILNFGLPAPIDVQVVGRNAAANYQIAQRLQTQIARIPGAADVHIHQVVDYPEIEVNVDRSKAGQVGLTQSDVTNSLLISLSSSGQVAPTQWLDWNNGVSYNVAVQTPQYRMDSLAALMRTPLTRPVGGILSHHRRLRWRARPTRESPRWAPGPSQATAGLWQSRGHVRRTATALQPGERGARRRARDRQPLQRAAGLRRVCQRGPPRPGRGGLGGREDRAAGYRAKLPRGTTLDLRGQVRTMETSFYRLGMGMIFAVVLVYLLMAVNFQSWLDPFIILMALPGALAGIVWMLFITQTTFSVPSLMGSIMCIGVATANSILMVVFANDQRAEGHGCARGGAVGRPHAHPPGADDGAGHDHRHAADGAGHGRRRRTERAAGPRRDRRPDAGHRHHAVRGPIGVQPAAEEAAGRLRRAGSSRKNSEYLRDEMLLLRTCHERNQYHRRPVARGNRRPEAPVGRTEEAGGSAARQKPSRAFAPARCWLLALVLVVLVVAGFFAGYLPRQPPRGGAGGRSEDRGGKPAGGERGEGEALRGQEQPGAARQHPGGHGSAGAGARQRLHQAALRGYRRPRESRAGAGRNRSARTGPADPPGQGRHRPGQQHASQQAEAALEQGHSQREPGAGHRRSAGRTCSTKGVVSRQENDTYQAQWAAQQANVQALEKAVAAARSNAAAAQANLARLNELKNYQTVRAPFAGVITVRNVDAGALVNEGNTLLFRIAQTDRLRTYLNVPQADAAVRARGAAGRARRSPICRAASSPAR